MVERPLSIWGCYSSEVELSAAVRMVGGSIPPDTFSFFLVFSRGLSSNGRAVDSHSTGRGIDTPSLHTKKEEFSAGRGIDAPILQSRGISSSGRAADLHFFFSTTL